LGGITNPQVPAQTALFPPKKTAAWASDNPRSWANRVFRGTQRKVNNNELCVINVEAVAGFADKEVEVVQIFSGF